MAKKPPYALSSQEVLQEEKTQLTGLSKETAQTRLNENGPNELAQAEKKSMLARFLDQFKDFMIIVLLAAALIAGFLLSEWADAGIILAVVLLNAVFGVFQESKAEEAIDALKEMSTPNAHVRRGDQVLTIPSSQLVLGDIVLLEAGDVVPADLRLVESANLKIEESALTGESVPVDKTSEPLTGADVGIGDRTNMAFMNSNITYGRGVGVVVATGMQTEVGRIAGMINSAEETTTPLQENLKSLGKTLTVMILVIAVIVFAVGIWRNAASLPEMFLTAVSLAVAAIPEGLPAIVTIILALGTQKMAKRHALVRKLPAVETLGSTDIIASDKTGTLTQNKMTVEKVYYDGQLNAASAGIHGGNPLMTIMNFANDTQVQDDGQLLGDPTETALVAYGKTQSFDLTKELAAEPRIAEVPFDSERKLMTTLH
ncbi:cation-translocating P-type ATPase, partial [Lacticaseibacillus rhamnosus]